MFKKEVKPIINITGDKNFFFMTIIVYFIANRICVCVLFAIRTHKQSLSNANLNGKLWNDPCLPQLLANWYSIIASLELLKKY